MTPEKHHTSTTLSDVKKERPGSQVLFNVDKMHKTKTTQVQLGFKLNNTGRRGKARTLSDAADSTFNFQYPRLDCTHPGCGSKDALISVGDTDYYDFNVLTNCWWETDLVSSFTDLLAHDAHRNDIKVSHCGFPHGHTQEVATGDKRELAPEVKFLVKVAFASVHFAFLKFDLEEKIIWVMDGKDFPLEA